MPALPFVLKRSNDVISGAKVTTTTERIHGLLRGDGESLVIQWRLARETDHIGAVIRTDHEYEPVREVSIPMSGIAGAAVRRKKWLWFKLPAEIVLTAADLRAFEEVAGEAGLKLDHPAALTLPVPEEHELAAVEFAADLNLRLAEREQQGGSKMLEQRGARTIAPPRGDVAP